ncbi:MAG: substrate-binding periplasmic protein [Kiritimatiellia bacterium]
MKSLFAFVVGALFFAGCATPTPKPDPSLLRVGITPDSPPLIFEQGGGYAGVEADFARKISAELGREPVFVKIPWSKQLDYLEDNRIDVVMSGMTVTPIREFRVNFTKPYMVSGQTALFRRNDFAANGLVPSVIRHQNSTIGVVKDTTGEIYATNTYTRGKILTFESKEALVAALKSKKVNMAIHDAPVIWWIAANNEAELAAFPELLNNESLAWAVSKNNPALLEQINAVMEEMKNDDSGRKILQNWFPNGE